MKKLKNIWAALFKRPKYLKLDTTMQGKLQVIEVEPDSNELTQALGMDPERAKHLSKITHEAFHTSNNVVELMAIVSKECLHANELYYVSHITANLHRDHQVPGFIRAIMGRQG